MSKNRGNCAQMASFAISQQPPVQTWCFDRSVVFHGNEQHRPTLETGCEGVFWSPFCSAPLVQGGKPSLWAAVSRGDCDEPHPKHFLHPCMSQGMDIAVGLVRIGLVVVPKLHLCPCLLNLTYLHTRSALPIPTILEQTRAPNFFKRPLEWVLCHCAEQLSTMRLDFQM